MYATMSFVLVAGVLLTVSACSKDTKTDDTSSSSRKSFEQNYLTFVKPIGGFCCISENKAKGITEVYSGVSPEESINTKTYHDSILVDDHDILYTFVEDIDTIWISNQTSDGFDMTVFGETYQFYGFNDIQGGIRYNILSPDGHVITQTLYHDSIDTQYLLKNMAEIDLFGNPFIGQNIDTKGSVLPVLKKVLKVGGWVGIAVSVAAIAVDVIENNCDRQLETDKHNCEHSSNKCLEKVSRCHYKCIPCN